MSNLLMALALMVLSAGIASAQQPDWFEYDNQIGIFLTEHPTVENAQEMANYTGGIGPVLVHVVLINPRDQITGQPIATVRAARFTVVVPDHVMLIESLPPNSGNAEAFPNYWIIGLIPVIDDHCTLLTFTLGVFTMEPSDWYLAPRENHEFLSIKAQFLSEEFSDAYPASGSLDAKVFSVVPGGSPGGVVATEVVNWGRVKALFH